MGEIIEIYNKSEKRTDKNLYCNLKDNFQNMINEDINKLKAYQMRCSSQKFSEHYTSSMALFISILGVINGIRSQSSKEITLAIILALIIAGVLISVIRFHKRDRKYMESLFVLNEIEKEMNERKNKEKQDKN